MLFATAIAAAFCMSCSGGQDAADASANADASNPQQDAAALLDAASNNVDASDNPDASAADATLAVAMPPVLTSARLVVHGTMALTWSLPVGGCSTITVNRKKDAGAYSVATMLTGVATETNDMPGHAVGTYCYTLVCTLAGVDSAPSNERCVTQ